MKKTILYSFLVFTILFGIPNYYIYTFPSVENIANVYTAKERKISILNFGDAMFDRGVRNIMEKYGRDPFQYIKNDLDLINNYNVIITNLEGPIVEMDRKKCQQKAYNFQFASTTSKLLRSIGINMVNIANNHIYDCYSSGIMSTKKYLEESGIEYIGDPNIEKSYVVKIINGKKVAFIGIDQTISPPLDENFYSLIKKLNLENDYVIVHIHWGTEYELGYTKSQKKVAHGLIDSGVDIIIGHHPHVIEPIEIYKNKVIVYSLGNFVFDQKGENETSGIGVGVEFKSDKTKISILPYKIKLFTPDFLKNEEKQSFCDKYLKFFDHKECSFEI